MYVCDIPYEVALKRHPRAVASILYALRRGTSIHRKAPPERLRWSYEYGTRIDTGSKPWDLKNQLARTRVTIHGRIGRWWKGAQTNNLPPEVRKHVRGEVQLERRVAEWHTRRA